MSDEATKVEESNKVRAKFLKTQEDMTEELKKLAVELRKKLKTDARGGMLIRWDIGEKIKEVTANEALYGNDAVETLAKVMGKLSAEELYGYRNMAKLYKREEVEALSMLEMANGGYITWAHMSAVLLVPTATERKKVWKVVFDEGLSAGDTKKEVGGKGRRNPRASGAGRKVKKPSSVAAGAQQIFTIIQKVNNLLPVWDKYVIQAIPNMPQAKVDDLLLAKVSAGIAQMAALNTSLAGHIKQYQKSEAHIRKIVKKTPAKTIEDTVADEEATGEPEVDEANLEAETAAA